jgi:ubiquinone/menaquinone biosynthesis C-methylase UbiE
VSTEGGRFDLFRDSARLGGPEARDLAERLERRGRSADEVAARAAYLDLLGLRAGERVLDAGCGSGVVTRELARRVGPTGRVVGVDPGAGFLAVARELAAREGLADRTEFREGRVEALPFPDRSFDVVLAVTVLSHVPGGAEALPELIRVTRPGGRVGIFDIDTDGFVLAHPDRALTRRIIAAHSDHGVVDGWLGRRLPGLLEAAGLGAIEARAFTPLERDPAGFYAGNAERAAETATRAGAITEAERQGWLDALHVEQAAGRFLAGRTHLFVWGTRPAGRP